MPAILFNGITAGKLRNQSRFLLPCFHVWFDICSLPRTTNSDVLEIIMIGFRYLRERYTSTTMYSRTNFAQSCARESTAVVSMTNSSERSVHQAYDCSASMCMWVNKVGCHYPFVTPDSELISNHIPSTHEFWRLWWSGFVILKNVTNLLSFFAWIIQHY